MYNDGFWESLDGVITALDNVEARLYVDQRCVYYQRALFDSGTLGSKGSVQTVVPQLTESYGASRDPPEESFPVCTLKNFPNRIEHCIQWAREAFEGHFHSAPATANALLSGGRAFIDDLLTRPNEALLTLQALHAALVQERPRSVADCVHWARAQFEVEYHHKIAQLLHVFPPHSTTSEGVPFWSATKRQPTPLHFDLGDPLHVAYVRSAARLRAVVYNIPWPAHAVDEEGAVRAAVANASLPPLTVAEVRIATTDAEAKALEEEKLQRGVMEDDAATDRSHELSEALLALREANPALGPLTAIDFEKVGLPPLARYPSSATAPAAAVAHTHVSVAVRCCVVVPPSLPPPSLPPPSPRLSQDDDSNGHMAFITAASNLRARNYRIKEESLHRTKQIAGKIIPAIATTTALVTGLVCLELYKWAGRRRALSAYRNSTVNLALPFLASAEPLPAATTTAAFPTGAWRWSQWDRIEVSEGRDLTLDELVALLRARFGVDTSMLSYGAAMLFYAFGNKKKMQQRGARTITQLIAEVTGKQLALPHSEERFIVLEACVNAPDGGDDVDIPFIRYQFR